MDAFIYRVLMSGLRESIPFDISLIVSYLRGLLTNLQRWHAFEVGQKHYDIGNDCIG